MAAPPDDVRALARLRPSPRTRAGGTPAPGSRGRDWLPGERRALGVELQRRPRRGSSSAAASGRGRSRRSGSTRALALRRPRCPASRAASRRGRAATAGSASTSPRGPAPSRRSQPLTRTSSPGRYIFRSSNTQKRSESVARGACASPRPRSTSRSLREDRDVLAAPRHEQRRRRVAEGEPGEPGASARAEPAPGRLPPRARAISTSPSGAPVGEVARPGQQRLLVGERVEPDAGRLDPRLDALARGAPSRATVGRTTRTTWPSPPSKAGARSSRVSVSASGSPPTRTVVSITRRPGGVAASSRQPFCRYACQAAQSSGAHGVGLDAQRRVVDRVDGKPRPAGGVEDHEVAPGREERRRRRADVEGERRPGSSALAEDVRRSRSRGVTR